MNKQLCCIKKTKELKTIKEIEKIENFEIFYMTDNTSYEKSEISTSENDILQSTINHFISNETLQKKFMKDLAFDIGQNIAMWINKKKSLS